MGYLLIILIFVSACYSVKAGTLPACAAAVIDCGNSALKLVFTIAGAMMIWGGIMKLLEYSGASAKLTKAMKPLMSKIFKGLTNDSAAIRAISMNVTANLLGLGNAATPLGIEAMKLLEKEEGASERPTKNMTLFAVMNACSLQIIPTTVAALRSAAGSAAPMEILPCVLVSSAISLAVALTVAEVLEIGH